MATSERFETFRFWRQARTCMPRARACSAGDVRGSPALEALSTSRNSGHALDSGTSVLRAGRRRRSAGYAQEHFVLAVHAPRCAGTAKNDLKPSAYLRNLQTDTRA